MRLFYSGLNFAVIVLVVGGCTSEKIAARFSPPQAAPLQAVPLQAAPPPAKPPAAIAVAASAAKPVAQTQQSQEQPHVVRVISNPAGATIMMDAKVLGVAPGKFGVIRTPNRYGFLPRMTITALPPKGAQGQFTQTKLFNGYTETPDLIIFDMNKPPEITQVQGQ